MTSMAEQIAAATSQSELSALLASDKIGMISVKSYGAVGDGSTDDTSAIQTAIDLCYATGSEPRGTSTPGVVYFPPGVYYISGSLTVYPGISIIGSGMNRSSDGVTSPFGGTLIYMAKDVNEPIFYSDQYCAGLCITNLRLQQETGSTETVTSAHGIFFDENASDISGVGELSLIDRVQIIGMGGDGIRYGSGTESQPIMLGHLSLIENAGYGVNFIGENDGHVRAIHIKGDNNGSGLIRISNCSNQSSYMFETVGVESNGTGHADYAILLENNTGGGVNLSIGQLDVRVTGELNAGASVIHSTSDTPASTNPSPNLFIGMFNYTKTAGITQGYDNLFYDANVAATNASANKITSSEADNKSISTGVIFHQNAWGAAYNNGIQFRSVKDGRTHSISHGDHSVRNNIRLNHSADGATAGAVDFYNGNTTLGANYDGSGSMWLLTSLLLGGSVTSIGAGVYVGTGTPEGSQVAKAGSIYLRTDGSAGTTAYVKESGTGNTGWIALMSSLSGSTTWDPGNLIDGAGETKSLTVTGAALGDFVLVSAPYDLQDITCTAYVQATNTVEIRLQNESGGAIDLGSGTWKVKVIKA